MLLLILGAALLASCRLELGVHVAMEDDGTGTVEVVVAVDPDGIERIGGDLGTVLEADDLTDTGWTVEGPRIEGDGYTRVRFRHVVSGPEEATAVFTDIAGEEGPFQDFTVRRVASLARTEWTFTGRIDFSGGLEAFGDAGLAAELDGEPLGQSVEEIEAQLGESLGEAILVRVRVQFPDEVSSNAVTVAGDTAEWEAGFGGPTVDLEATAVEQRTSTLAAAGAGASCAVLLVVYGLVRLVRRGSLRRGAHARP